MANGGTPLPDGVTQRIEMLLDGMMAEYDVPGVSIAVFDADEIRHADGYGTRNIDTRAPATENTLYSVASITKTVTAVAILQLVEDGVINLDDEIRQYVQFWNDVPGDPIRVHELLSHSSGMPSDFANRRRPLFADSPPVSPIVARADYVRHANGMADQRVDDPDGFMYNPTGYEILGDLLEAATGNTYAEHVEENIFAPLGMNRSRVGHGKLAGIGGDCSLGYEIEDGEPVSTEFDPETDSHPPHSAGGILSSVVEVARLERCLMNGGELDDTRIVSSELVSEMCSHQSPSWETIDGDRLGYGYGVAVEDFAGETLVYHNGIIPGVCRTVAGFVEEEDVGVVLAANSATAPISSFGKGVLALALGVEPREIVPYLSLQEKVEAVTGTYEGYRGGMVASVDPAGAQSGIQITYEEGPEGLVAFPVTTTHDDYRFYTVAGTGRRVPVTFRETDDGMVMLRDTERLTRTRR